MLLDLPHVADPGRRLDLEDFQPPVKKLVDGRLRRRVAALIDLTQQAGTRLLSLARCIRPGRHYPNQVMTPLRQRVNTRVHADPERAAGEGVDGASLALARGEQLAS